MPPTSGMSHAANNMSSTKKAANRVGSGPLVRRLRALEKRWMQEARAFHSMGKRMSREGNMAGNEYMQTAAAFRACARELKAARLPNTADDLRPHLPDDQITKTAKGGR